MYRLASVIALVCAASTALADPRATFSLDYSVPEGCPDRAEFVRAVSARSSHARETESDAALALSVVITGERAQATGTLRMTLSDGQSAERPVPAAPCQDVLTSMAIIAAMVLDGGGLDAPTPSAGSTLGTPIGDTAPAPTPERPRRPPDAPRAAPAPARAARGSDAAPARTARWSAALLATAERGVAPSVVPGVEFGAGVTWAGSDGVGPGTRLGLRLAQSGTTEVASLGRARFRLITASWSACPTTWAVTRAVHVVPCALVEAGDLRGAGTTPRVSREEHMSWLGFGATLGVEVRLGSRFDAQLQAHGLRLARHDRFVFTAEPDHVVHDVPAFTGRLGAGLRVWLP